MLEPDNIDLGDGDELKLVVDGKRKAEDQLGSRRMNTNIAEETHEDSLVKEMLILGTVLQLQ